MAGFFMRAALEFIPHWELDNHARSEASESWTPAAAQASFAVFV